MQERTVRKGDAVRRWRAVRLSISSYNTWQFPFRARAAMVSAETKSIIARAKQIYADSLQAALEPQHKDPESGEYFLADTFDEAVRSARAKYPSRLSHTIRIGHRAAFNIGGLQG